MIRIWLASGGFEDFDADSFSFSTADDGRSIVGLLRLWKTDSAQKEPPQVVAMFAPHGWLAIRDIQGALHERSDVGFKPPSR